jgi:hypothetical protein
MLVLVIACVGRVHIINAPGLLGNNRLLVYFLPFGQIMDDVIKY